MTKQIAYRKHNHENCVKQALKTAEKICMSKNTRLTEIRQRVLELVWQQHKPCGAYDIIALLGKDGQYPAPPTVYRALDFLLQQGLIHRIASMNAYIGCSLASAQNHASFFYICSQCSLTTEVDADTITTEIHKKAKQQGFFIESQTIEVTGLCPKCQD